MTIPISVALEQGGGGSVDRDLLFSTPPSVEDGDLVLPFRDPGALRLALPAGQSGQADGVIDRLTLKLSEANLLTVTAGRTVGADVVSTLDLSSLAGGDQTASEIRDALQTLQGDDRLDASAIKNLPAAGAGSATYTEILNGDVTFTQASRFAAASGTPAGSIPANDDWGHVSLGLTTGSSGEAPYGGWHRIRWDDLRALAASDYGRVVDLAGSAPADRNALPLFVVGSKLVIWLGRTSTDAILVAALDRRYPLTPLRIYSEAQD